MHSYCIMQHEFYFSMIDLLIHFSAFFGSEGHVALDRNTGPGYDSLFLRLVPGFLLSACPIRHFHALPGLKDSRVALPTSYPNALRAMQGGSFHHFYDGLRYDLAGRRTHDLPDTLTTKPTRHGFMSQILYINILVDWSLSGIMTSKLVIRESESPRPAASSILISRVPWSLSHTEPALWRTFMKEK